MTLLFESPYPALLVGAAFVVLLGSGWLQTGQKWILYVIGAVVLLTIAAVWLEHSVETDRERVAATLYEIADLVEQNKIAEAMEFAYSASPEVRDRAVSELSWYKFHEVRIKQNLEITVDPEHIPPKATATFNVVVVFSRDDQMLDHRHVPRYVEVVMYQEQDGRWKVAEYRHDDPRRGFTVDRQSQAP